MDMNEVKQIIESALKPYPELYSPAAIELLLGTAASESDMGEITKQVGGQALSIFQIERDTFQDLQARFGKQYGFNKKIFTDVRYDHKLAALVARLKYRSIKSPLPKAGDTVGQAKYWKKYYNTEMGKGTIKGYLAKYKVYCYEPMIAGK